MLPSRELFAAAMSSEPAKPQTVQYLHRPPGLLLVLDTPKGRGIFANETILKGTTIEISPVLVFTEEEVSQHTMHTCLQHYTYYWPTSDGRSTTQAIALGLGSMFNHSTVNQNVVWSRNVEGQCIIYTAHRDIDAGEELCISYGSRLWFKDSDVSLDDEYSRIVRHQDELDHSAVELEISGLGGIDV